MTLRAYFRDEGRLMPVQDRLIQANITRRNRLDIYLGMYRRKLTAQKGISMVVDRVAHAAVETTSVLQHTQPVLSQTKSQSSERTLHLQDVSLQSSTIHKSALSSQTATGIGSFVMPQQIPRQEARSVSTRTSQGVLKQNYPKCPIEEGESFWCPYCAQPLDSSYSNPKKNRKWRYVELNRLK